MENIGRYNNIFNIIHDVFLSGLIFPSTHTCHPIGAVVFGQSSHVPVLLCTLIHYIAHIYVYKDIDISKHSVYKYYICIICGYTHIYIL